MKKLLAIVVLSLLLSVNANAFGDFFLKGTTPATLTEMGFKLFSVEYRPDFDRHQILYTFTKDKNIVTCLVHLDHFRGEPSYNHRCFNITGLDRD